MVPCTNPLSSDWLEFFMSSFDRMASSDDYGPLAPMDDCEYPVALGQSLLNINDELEELSDVYTSFSYEFQPASVDKSTPGLVSVDGSNGVHVLMASSTGGVNFKGKVVEQKDTDCLLIFDGSGFRLERCAFSCVQLRHVRAPTPRRRMSMQLKQKSVDPADGVVDDKTIPASSTKTVRKTSKKPLGRPKGSGKQTVQTVLKKVVEPSVAKRPRGRPKKVT